MRIRKDLVAMKVGPPRPEDYGHSQQRLCPFCGSYKSYVQESSGPLEVEATHRTKRHCVDCRQSWWQDQVVRMGQRTAVVTGGIVRAKWYERKRRSNA